MFVFVTISPEPSPKIINVRPQCLRLRQKTPCQQVPEENAFLIRNIVDKAKPFNVAESNRRGLQIASTSQELSFLCARDFYITQGCSERNISFHLSIKGIID